MVPNYCTALSLYNYHKLFSLFLKLKPTIVIGMAISLFSLAIFSLVLNPIFCLDADWQSANATWHPSIRVGRIGNGLTTTYSYIICKNYVVLCFLNIYCANIIILLWYHHSLSCTILLSFCHFIIFLYEMTTTMACNAGSSATIRACR